jgi:hypothetical protein
MGGYLLDTNVLSELRKGDRCNPKVRAWLEGQVDDELFISVLALAEIRDGIERLRPRDPRQAARLERWLRDTETTFGERVLPVTARVADRWGRLRHPQPLPDFDRLLAATAAEHRLEIVTRNVGDFERSSVAVVNPWET